MLRLISFILLIVIFHSCSAQQFPKSLEDFGIKTNELSTAEVEQGLRAALEKGVKEASEEVSQVGGYLNDPQIRIPFPPEVEKVETRLRSMGMDRLVDDFIETLNRGAEEAATEAKPIFVNAIRQMTIQDAMDILRGSNDEATQYLKRTTTAHLTEKFQPVISEALQQTGATKYYADIVNTYNKIPLVQKVNPDLEAYATQKAIDGLFLKIAEEEQKIRQDPAARTSEILRKVFGREN